MIRYALSHASQTTSPVDGSTRRFRKDAIRVGRFIARNPIDGADLEINATPERLDRWVANFSRMRQAGVKCDLTVDHMPSSKAEAKRGEVVRMFRARVDGDQLVEDADGDTLGFETDVADDDGVTLLSRCPEVSIEIDPDFRDGNGNRYGEVIPAISVVTKPVVPGQQPFMRIAASQSGGGQTALLCFSADSHTTDPSDPSRSNDMFNAEQRTKVIETLGLDDKADDKAIAEKIMLSLGSVTEAKTLKDDKAKLAKQVEDLTAERDSLNVKLSQNAGGDKIVVDEDVLEETAQNITADINRLVADAYVTPAQAEKLKLSLVGPENSRRVVALSIKGAKAAGLAKPYAREVIDAIRASKPEDLGKLIGEKTGGQAVALSRTAGGDTDPNLTKEMAEQASAAGGSNVAL